jgi:hypothetical protein
MAWCSAKAQGQLYLYLSHILDVSWVAYVIGERLFIRLRKHKYMFSFYLFYVTVKVKVKAKGKGKFVSVL